MIYLDYSNIFDYSQISPDYLFVDKAEIIPGESGKGVKNLSMQDWFFKIHFPGNPIMPGVILMDTVMEVGTLVINTMIGKAKKLILFSACDNVKISGEARPGDILNMEVILNKYRRGIANFSGKAYIGEKQIIYMEFVLVVKDEIIHIG